MSAWDDPVLGVEQETAAVLVAWANVLWAEAEVSALHEVWVQAAKAQRKSADDEERAKTPVDSVLHARESEVHGRYVTHLGERVMKAQQKVEAALVELEKKRRR